MIIETKFLGEVEVLQEDILTFEFGLLGFPEAKQFVLLPIDTNTPLVLLQSISEVEIGFVLAFPFAFKHDYAFDISEEDTQDIQIEQVEDVLTYSIITLKENFLDSTLNLLAPVLINIKKKVGKQIVLHDKGAYELRYPIGEYEGSAK